MSAARTAATAAAAETLCSEVSRLAAEHGDGSLGSRVDLHRVWVFRDRVVVLDYLVHGGAVAFDVIPDEGGDEWRLVVHARHSVDRPQVAALGLPPAARPDRFRVGSPIRAADDTQRASLADVVLSRCRGVLDKLTAVGPAPQTSRLLDALGVSDPLVVVDVGANPLELPAYTRLLGMGVCRVVGFEPQPEAFARLQGRDPQREQYFPHAIGSPGQHQLRIYEGSGFASTYAIDETSIDFIANERWRDGTRLRETIDLELTALDDVPDLPAFDLLKIDVQGGELAVFESGRRSLSSALCVIPEVSFFPLYDGAPSFADVHQELVAQGFALHKFMFQKSVHLHGSQSGEESVRASRSQLVDGDAVYLRDLRGLADFSSVQVAKLVLLATYVFDSPDLAVRGLDELVRRGEVSKKVVKQYVGQRYV
jgi:FkbM family methyltransferase